MAQTIKLKRSSTAGNVPSTADLSLGEIAINTADGAVYIKKNDGSDSIVAIHDDDVLKIDTGNSRIGIGNTGLVNRLVNRLVNQLVNLDLTCYRSWDVGTLGNGDGHAIKNKKRISENLRNLEGQKFFYPMWVSIPRPHD